MKKVCLLTKNWFKYQEYKQFFRPYHIQVEIIRDFEYLADRAELLRKYNHLVESAQVLSVLFDETGLYREVDNTRLDNVSEEHDGELVYSITVLYYLKDNQIATFTSAPHKGIIDYSARTGQEKLFGWDDVFVVRPTGLSYQELKQRNMKNHSRQEVLSAFVIHYLYYKENIHLNFNPSAQTEVIEFSYAIFDLIDSNPCMNSPTVKAMKLDRLFQYALTNGGFFRSSRNRRQKNYWAPGLNAGIPMVPKKDEIHEITFLVHDLCHFVLPDLLYSGEDNPLYDRVYILYRMLSEALTLVLADMIFIDALVKDGIDYDYSKRKIYPLYQAILKKNPAVALTDVLAANVQYCLLGDDQAYKQLIHKEDIVFLTDFKDKYEAFFVADFEWTRQNLTSMKQQARYFREWYQENKAVFHEQKLLSIEDFTRIHLRLTEDCQLTHEQLVHRIRDVVVGQYIQIMETEMPLSREERLSNSFKKYMLGQMLLLYRMDFLQYSQFLKRKIGASLLHSHFDLKRIQRLRAMYTDYLHLLESDYHLIHKDDVETYKELYPVFESFYVFYDRKPEKGVSLKEAARHALEAAK